MEVCREHRAKGKRRAAGCKLQAAEKALSLGTCDMRLVTRIILLKEVMILLMAGQARILEKNKR